MMFEGIITQVLNTVSDKLCIASLGWKLQLSLVIWKSGPIASQIQIIVCRVSDYRLGFILHVEGH